MGNERHQEIIVRLCKRAVELDPSYAALGAAHQGQGRYEIGLKACESALGLDPESYEGNRGPAGRSH